MSKQVYPQRTNSTAMVNVCLTCPHRQQCARISALSHLPDPPGYIPLGTALACPDGCVELVLACEMPGETFKVKEFNRVYA